MHQVVVLGVPILDQRTLHGLFMGIGGNIHRLHGSGVQPCIIHHRGDGGGRGVEVRHLLGVQMMGMEILRQGHRLG